MSGDNSLCPATERYDPLWRAQLSSICPSGSVLNLIRLRLRWPPRRVRFRPAMAKRTAVGPQCCETGWPRLDAAANAEAARGLCSCVKMSSRVEKVLIKSSVYFISMNNNDVWQAIAAKYSFHESICSRQWCKWTQF